jgi:hypothetical protein
MNSRELLLLSPYRMPGQNPLMLAHDDMAGFLNGYAALWHPAALRGAKEPPRVASPYDHEQPGQDILFAVPETPPLILPDDWDERVTAAGAIAFRSTPDRESTLANLRQALEGKQAPSDSASWDAWSLPPELVRPFLAIGFGFVQVTTLSEAMEHENLLASSEFWQDVQQALAALAGPDAEAVRQHLRSAAERLLAAREVLYPATIYLVDIHFLDADSTNMLPDPLDMAIPCNLIASGALLMELARARPERCNILRERISRDLADVCGGCYVEREDALLPFESQLWNLQKGLAVSREVLGSDVHIFARKRFAFHPQTPLLLNSVGLRRVLGLAFDDSVLPTYRATVTNWPSTDGKQVEAFTRTPYPADSPLTFFHAAHYLHKTIMADQAATVALLHKGAPAAPWYQDWLELSRLAPVLGRWTTLTSYFNDVLAGEHASPPSADDFHADYLTEDTEASRPDPVSGFAWQARRRRQIDTAWTLATMHRVLSASREPLAIEVRLAEGEDHMELDATPKPDLAALLQEAAQGLAERLLARAPANPGYLVLNPCSFARRVPLELEGAVSPLPVGGPLKACQIDTDKTRLVIEVPALGFAWIPRAGPVGTPPMTARMRLADAHHVRNEFFEAEIDPATGGLRGFCDYRTRVNRIGQQLVYNPGSRMRATEVKVISTGPALGEVISAGTLMDEQDEVLATFRQRFRAWLGRPLLELRIEITPRHSPDGYPWHAYYGARFAWRDERSLLLRGVNGTGYITTHTRPESPDYLEIRQGRHNTVLFPGGLPFHQRHGTRMLDVILVPAGETAPAFELGLGLDRDLPMQTALGMITPVPVVPVDKGPPSGGPSGWLFHLDAPQLLLTGCRPGPAGADALAARLLECGTYGSSAELRCVRVPQRAMLLDARGELLRDMSTAGDAVLFDMAQGEWAQLRVEFS